MTKILEVEKEILDCTMCDHCYNPMGIYTGGATCIHPGVNKQIQGWTLNGHYIAHFCPLPDKQEASNDPQES